MEIVSQQQRKLEWDDLSQEGRNCLLWPDFLEWGPEKVVDVKKASEDDVLGIVTIVFQSPETKTCFHIIKQVKEGRLAAKSVKQFDWITAVNGKPTTRVKESEELVQLTKNGKSEVRLTIRRAVDPLKNIKQWSSKEKDGMLEDCSKDLGFRLSHFYSKVKNDDNRDHILIFEVESGKDGKSKTSKLLSRGDELMSVNGEHLTGKKLKDIYGLFFKSQNVEIKIKRILHGKTYQGELGKTAVRHPDQIYWMHDKKEVTFGALSQDSTCGLRFLSLPKSNSEFFHIVSKVTEGMPADQANVCVGSSLLSVNDHDITHLDRKDAEVLMRNNKNEWKLVMAVPGGLKQQQVHVPKKRRASLTKRDSHSSSTPEDPCDPRPEDPCQSEKCCGFSQSLLPITDNATNKTKKKQCQLCNLAEQSNEAFQNSGDEPDTKPLCKTCKKNKKTLKRLPADKQKWPLKKMDQLAFQKICDDLETPVPSKDMNYVAAHLGFSREDIKRTTQRFSVFSGQGAADVYLSGWVEKDPQNHLVGKLREILEGEEVERKTAVQLIEEWLRQNCNCFGCGAIIS